MSTWITERLISYAEKETWNVKTLKWDSESSSWNVKSTNQEVLTSVDLG